MQDVRLSFKQDILKGNKGDIPAMDHLPFTRAKKVLLESSQLTSLLPHWSELHDRPAQKSTAWQERWAAEPGLGDLDLHRPLSQTPGPNLPHST